MSGSQTKVMLLIPAYNEAENIVGLIRGIGELDRGYFPLVVNDGSADETAALARRHCTTIDLPINLGIGGAVQAGFLFARERDFDVAVQVDADGQHPPDQIHLLLEPILDGRADVAIGSRFIDGQGYQSSYARRKGIGVLRAVLRLATGRWFSDPTSGFRAFNRRAIAAVAGRYPADYPEPEALVSLLRLGLRVVEVPVAMRPRQAGVSSIRPLASLYYVAKVSLAILFEALRGKR